MNAYVERGTAATPQYVIDYVPICRQFEGDISWMYLDTAGNVTVGIGFMIPTAHAACGYAFCLPGGEYTATEQEIISAWTRVKAMEAGHLPEHYHYLGALVLSEANTEMQLFSILAGTDENLRLDFPGFETWPDSAKMGAADMDYNLGDARLRDTYPKFDAAADRGDFTTMALECHRRGIGNARNVWTKQMFMAAAKA